MEQSVCPDAAEQVKHHRHGARGQGVRQRSFFHSAVVGGAMTTALDALRNILCLFSWDLTDVLTPQWAGGAQALPVARWGAWSATPANTRV